MDCIFTDIPGYSAWTNAELINYGWSSDIKYYIEDNQNNKYLLRISAIDVYEQKKREFDIIKKFNVLSFHMSRAMDFGICNNNQNVYMLLSWVQGVSLEEAIVTLPEQEQYQLGLKAGRVLKSIHSLKVDPRDIPETTKTAKKMLQLERYENSSFRVKNDENAINYVKNNINKICKSPCAYTHGDFHFGNLIYTSDGEIGVIDFNRWECGDRFEEFYKLQSFGVDRSIPFCIGQLHGYFDGKPTISFWEIQAVYVAHASLFSIEWASKFGQTEIDYLTKRCLEAFEDYDNFNLVIPKWYSENCDKYL